MAHTFHIRRRDGHLYIIDGSSDVAEPSDISVDFNLGDVSRTFNFSPGTEASATKDFLKCITKVEVTPGLKSVYRNPNLGWWLMGFGVLLFGLFGWCAWYLIYHHKDHPVRSLILAAAWTILVPVYFYIEHEFFFFYWGDTTQYERFKRVQDLATKIWAGAIAVLGAILAANLKN